MACNDGRKPDRKAEMLGYMIRSTRKARRWVSSKNLTSRVGVERAAARESVDCMVIGAGAVGIAVARELALKGREVVVVESASTFGTGTSSRNSEVIHAGIYYPRNSLKVPFQSHSPPLLLHAVFYNSNRAIAEIQFTCDFSREVYI